MSQLFFFTLVNAAAARGFDGETRRKVVPEVMPRALFFFRFGALFTWVTGIFLVGFVYHLGGLMVRADAAPGAQRTAVMVSQALIFFGFFAYDLLWKSPLGKNEWLGGAVSLGLFVGVAWGLSQLLAGRALWIHLGAILGSVMTLNVWMRIWPAQKKLIRALKETGPQVGPEVAALAALRGKHNLYMGIPILFFMVSAHTFPLGYGDEYNWLTATAVMVIGWAAAKVLVVVAGSGLPVKAP
jgi:uncharacterized membrane protein